MEKEPLLILHADDDEGDRMLFEEALERVTVKTRLISFSGGEELLNYLAGDLEKFPYALFLDLNMPKINGFECLSKIKQNEKLKNVPVIICSTSGDERSVRKTYDNGAHLYIIKPFDFAAYVKVLEEALILIGEKKFVRPQLDTFVLNNGDGLLS